MRRPSALSALALLIALAASACGTSHFIELGGAAPSAPAASSPAATGPGPTPAAPATPLALSAADLDGALLTAGDVPGATLAARLPGYGSSSMSACPALAGVPAGTAAQASDVLVDPTSGATISESLFELSGGAAADAAMARFRALPADCRAFGGTLAGYQVSFTTRALALPRVGEQSTASRIQAAVAAVGQSGTLYEDVVAIRSGNLIVLLIHLGAAADDSLTRQAAETAYEKAASAVAETAPAAAPSPVPQTATLSGYWQDASGDVLQFTAAGGSWTGRVVHQGSPGICAPVDLSVTGAGGRRFEGTMADYAGAPGSCGRSVGLAAVTLVVEPDGASLAVTGTSTAGPCPACAPAVWTRAAGADGGTLPTPQTSAAPAPEPAPPAAPGLGVSGITVALIAILALAVLLAALSLARRPRPTSRAGGAPLEGIRDEEDPAPPQDRPAARLRRVLLTDPDVLPAATTIRFATLVLTIVAATASIYAFMGLTVLRASDPATRLCLAGASEPAVGSVGQLTVDANVELGCTRSYAASIIGWSLAGAVLVIVFTLLIYAVTPWWMTRRLTELESGAAFERIRLLAQRLGVQMPHCWLTPDSHLDTGARAFGRRRHGQLRLDQGLLAALEQQPEAFDAVLLHELAHLRNRDNAPTYLAFAAWRVFVAIVLLPYLVLLFIPGLAAHPFRLSSLRLDPQWPGLHILGAVAAMTALVYLSRSAVLRIRETHADATAAICRPVALRELLERQALRETSRIRALPFLAFHPRASRRLRDVADPTVLAAPDGAALFTAGFAISLITVNVQFASWVLAVASWASHGGLLAKMVNGAAGNGDIMLFEVGTWGPAAVLQLALICGLACAVMWRARICALPGGGPASSLRAAAPLALGLMLGQPFSVVYSDAGTWGAFDVNGAWEWADAAASTLALGLIAALLFRWAAESAAVWIPVTRRSLRRACAAAALVGVVAAAPAMLVFMLVQNSGAMTSLLHTGPTKQISGWFGAHWAFTLYIPLNDLEAQVPTGGLLFALPCLVLAAGALRKTEIRRPRWLPRELTSAEAAPLFARPRARVGTAVSLGLAAAGTAVIAGLAIMLVLRAQTPTAAIWGDRALGGLTLMTGWLSWITVSLCATAALIAARKAPETAVTTALLTAFVAASVAVALLPIPLYVGLCGSHALTCATHPAAYPVAPVFEGMATSIPVRAAIIAALTAGAVHAARRLAGHRDRAVPASPPSPLTSETSAGLGSQLSPVIRARQQVYVGSVLAASVLILAVGLWLYIRLWQRS